MSSARSPKQRPYQIAGSEFLRSAGRAILADEPGLGKTNQLLKAAEGRTLVLSPAALSDVWSEEIETWAPDADITWTSYSSLVQRVEDKKGRKTIATPNLRPEYGGRWDTVICDEAHYLKNRGTNWTKAMVKANTDRLYLATGTPLPNWGHEIFSFLRLLHPKDRRFTNYWNWVNEWFRTWNPPWGGTEIRGLQRGVTWDEAAEAWGLPGRWLRREMDEVLPDLPPMTMQTILVKMTPKQATVYNKLKKDYTAVLPDTGNELVLWDGGGLHTKLLQASTGLGTLELGNKGSGKLDAVKELLMERTRPTILFCAFKNTAESLVELVQGMGRSYGVVSSAYSMADRKGAIAAFRGGKTEVMIGTVGTLSEGVTLTQADTCIFVERSPRPITNEQARRRIRRFGQERPTLSIDLVTEGTVDDGLSQLLAKKVEDRDLALTGFQLAALA